MLNFYIANYNNSHVGRTVTHIVPSRLNNALARALKPNLLFSSRQKQEQEQFLLLS